uniref:Uncharacterized protein n=1 Tax=Fagus sylvatica TaxID=28930 RepID=A0A2N9IZ87_FAGSY
MANHPAAMQLHPSRSHCQKLLSPITDENSLTLRSRSLSSSPCLSQNLLDLQHPCMSWVHSSLSCDEGGVYASGQGGRWWVKVVMVACKACKMFDKMSH